MDLLDRIADPARDLLCRVDTALRTGGAPPEHPILPLLRGVGALPGEAVDRVCALVPGPLAAAGDPLRTQAREYRRLAESVPAPATWRGPAAEAYAAQWSGLSAHLAGDRDTLAGRLADTADFADDVAAWISRGRQAVAGTLAECLASAEAVTVRSAATPGTAGRPSEVEAARAAATIGAHVLTTISDVVNDGQEVRDRWAGRLDELGYRSAVQDGAAAGGLRLGG